MCRSSWKRSPNCCRGAADRLDGHTPWIAGALVAAGVVLIVGGQWELGTLTVALALGVAVFGAWRQDR